MILSILSPPPRAYIATALSQAYRCCPVESRCYTSSSGRNGKKERIERKGREGEPLQRGTGVTIEASPAVAPVANGTLSAQRTSRRERRSVDPERLMVAEYLWPHEAAGIVDVHPKTLERWAKADPTLPMLKVAGTVRFPRERFLKWLRDREQGRPAGRQATRNLLPSPPSSASPKASL